MKKHLLYLLMMCLPVWAIAQVATITVSNNSLCAGDTLHASVMPPVYSQSGTTGSNQQNGVMFDLTATMDFVVRDFIITNNSGTTTIEVYSRPGSHVGHESNPASWTLLATVSNVPVGSNLPLNLNLDLPVIIGQTRAFYITTTATSMNIEYATAANPVGSVLSSNSYFELKVGAGKGYPFGATFSPRSFVGAVIYSPKVLSTEWNTGDTTASIAFVPDKSMILSARLSLSGGIIARSPGETVNVSELEVAVTANPYTIAPGGSSTLSSSVLLRRGIATTMAAGNEQNGAMFDVVATAPVVIYGFTVNFTTENPGDLEVLYKTGSHVGHEGNAGVWTSLGSHPQLSGGYNMYVPLNNPVNVSNGDTVAFYVTRTDLGGYLHYSNGSQLGAPAATAPGIQVLEGKGVSYPFGATFSPRILNTILHYKVTNPSGITYSWDVGGSGGSMVVSPGATTTYTLTVTRQGCSASDTVRVTVSGIGINDNEPTPFRIYPNPASDLLMVETREGDPITQYYLTDVQGRMVSEQIIPSNSDRLQIPVSNIQPGLYLLHMKVNGQKSAFKVIIAR